MAGRFAPFRKADKGAIVITVKGVPRFMSMSKLAVKVARKSLIDRNFSVRYIRDLDRFSVKKPFEASRALYEGKPQAIFTAEELVTMAGCRELDRFQKRGGF